MNNHAKKIERMIQAGEIRGRDVRNLTVYHDEGCSLLNGRGPCDCDPEITKPQPKPWAKNKDSK